MECTAGARGLLLRLCGRAQKSQRHRCSIGLVIRASPGVRPMPSPVQATQIRALFFMRRGNGCVRRRAHVQVYIRAHTHTHLVYAHVRYIFPLERRSTAWLPVGDTIFVRAEIFLRSCSCAHLEDVPKHMSVDRRGFEINKFGRMQTSCYRTGQSLCICVYVFHAIIHSCMHTFLVGGLDQPAGDERSPSQKWISMKLDVHFYA